MSLVLEGKAKAAAQAHRDRGWHAWHVAALYRAKKLPKLTELTGEPKKKGRKKPQKWEKLLAIAKAWDAALSQ